MTNEDLDKLELLRLSSHEIYGYERLSPDSFAPTRHEYLVAMDKALPDLIAAVRERDVLREAAENLCSTATWQERKMPSGAVIYDAVVSSDSYEALLNAFQPDKTPATGEDNK